MSDKKCGATCSDGSECNNYPITGQDRCRHHGGQSTGPKTEEGKKKSRMNAQTHGIHTSAEIFFEEAPQRHLDTYYAYHESLCSRYERMHSGGVDYGVKKDLAEVAFEMAKLDMGKEYQAEHAVDPEKPLTERQTQDVGGALMDLEAISRIEKLKTDIRRENRLLLKDMGIYNSPEQQQAQADSDLGELARKVLTEE